MTHGRSRVAGAPAKQGRRRLFIVVLLFLLAAGIWAQAPLRRLWLSSRPLDDLAAHVGGHPSDTDASLLLAERYLKARQPAQAEALLVQLAKRGAMVSRAWLLLSEAEY